jgi:flavin reductase (DIM6/NTAB) family NADH-FMN oxidoreductase RutF
LSSFRPIASYAARIRASNGLRYPVGVVAETGGSLLSLFWTPIVAVGCSGGSIPNAQISVSTFGAGTVPERPRILSVLYKGNYTHDLVLEKGDFSISVLSEKQTALIPALGFESGRERKKLDGLDFELTARGNPVFRQSLGWFECEVIEMFDFGDATAFLAAVMEMKHSREGKAMTWSAIAPTLPQQWLEAWRAKQARDAEIYRAMMHWLE